MPPWETISSAGLLEAMPPTSPIELCDAAIAAREEEDTPGTSITEPELLRALLDE